MKSKAAIHNATVQSPPQEARLKNSKIEMSQLIQIEPKKLQSTKKNHQFQMQSNSSTDGYYSPYQTTRQPQKIQFESNRYHTGEHLIP